MIKNILSLIVLFLLIGCSKQLKEGVIINKQYNEGYYYTSTTMVMAGKVMVPMTNTFFVEEEWELTITNDTISSEVYVSQECYTGVVVGDYITLK